MCKPSFGIGSFVGHFPKAGFFYLSGAIGTATAQKIDMIFPKGLKGRSIVV